MATKNLGQVAGVFIGTTPPTNTTLIWYDNTPSINRHKVYDAGLGKWVVLDQNVITSITYSELTNKAKGTGLSVGQWFMIKDKGNALALTITSTKVQYDDAVGNILIDDLGTNVQYHVTSSNLTIDDVAGVFDNANSKLTFRFTDATPDANNEDYLLGKIKRNNVWSLVKYKLSSLISKVTGNSITWNGGLFFNLKKALEDATDITGGWVSYDEYTQALDALRKAIDNVGKENQGIIENAQSALKEATKPESIYGAKLPSLDTTGEPVDIAKGDTLLNIVAKVQRFINRFKYADGIRIPANYADKTVVEWVNNNDTVSSAFAKLQFNVRHIDRAGKLSDDWLGHGSGGVIQDVEKGDTIGLALTKIVRIIDALRGKIDNAGASLVLSKDWAAKDWNTDIALPVANDTFDEAFAKVVGKLNQIGDITSSGFTSKRRTTDQKFPIVSILNSSGGHITLHATGASGHSTELTPDNLKVNSNTDGTSTLGCNHLEIKSVDSVKQVIADLDEGLHLTSIDGTDIKIGYAENTGMIAQRTGSNQMEATVNAYRLVSDEGRGDQRVEISIENGVIAEDNAASYGVSFSPGHGILGNSPTVRRVDLLSYETDAGHEVGLAANYFNYKRHVPGGTDPGDVGLFAGIACNVMSGIGAGGNVTSIYDAYFHNIRLGGLCLSEAWYSDSASKKYIDTDVSLAFVSPGIEGSLFYLPASPRPGHFLYIFNISSGFKAGIDANGKSIIFVSDPSSGMPSVSIDYNSLSFLYYSSHAGQWYLMEDVII